VFHGRCSVFKIRLTYEPLAKVEQISLKGVRLGRFNNQFYSNRAAQALFSGFASISTPEACRLPSTPGGGPDAE
jgi:hypothetical protein